MTATATKALQTPAEPAGAAPAPGERLERIPLAELHESPLNPRQHYDPAALDQLKDSLLATGQLTPIVVRPRAKGGYEIGAGHRRLRAARLAVQHHKEGADYRGLGALLAIVRELDDPAFIELLNIENLQRDDLHPLEEAEGFRTLMERAGYDIPKIAARIGRSTRYVYDGLTLLKLVPEAKKLFLAGTFERGHAIELARLMPTDQQRALGSDRSSAYRVGGLFVPGLADVGGFALDGKRGHESRKPASVREFKRWIDEEIRFKPAEADLMLFPDTVQALSDATAQKEKVVEITYEHQIPDAARDPKAPRIYGAQAWRSATKGRPGPEFPPRMGKPCDHAVTGVVVIGESRGQAFKVCLAKEKCAVHWSDWQKERARRSKQNVTGAQRASADRKDRWDRQQAKEKAERARWGKARVAIRHALEAKLRELPVTPISAATRLAWPSYDGRLPKAKTLEDLIRAKAREHVLHGTSGEYQLASNAQRYGKLLGVDVQKIVDRVAPAEKPASKKRPVKKAARAKKKGKR